MQPLPLWTTVVAVLTVLGLLVYSIVVMGAEGYPTTVMLGGLLGGYMGVQGLLKKKGGGDDK